MSPGSEPGNPGARTGAVDALRPMPTAVLSVPWRQGWTWVADALRQFLRQPMPLYPLISMGYLVLVTVQLLPYLGPVLAAVMVPTLALGMMKCCRTAADGQAPTVQDYLVGPRSTPVRRELLVLGMAYLVATLALSETWNALAPPDEAVATASAPASAAGAATDTAAAPAGGSPDTRAVADGNPRPAPPAAAPPSGNGTPAAAGEAAGGSATSGPAQVPVMPVPGLAAPAGSAPPAATPPSSGTGTAQASSGTAYYPAMLVVFPLSCLFQALIWFAPPLVAWNGMRAGKAMFFSFFIVWRNLGAVFLTFALVVGLTIVVVGGFGGSLVSLLGLGLSGAMVVLLPLVLAVASIAQMAITRMFGEVVRVLPPADEPTAAGSSPPTTAAP